jgi:phage baseplate assembly protein W
MTATRISDFFKNVPGSNYKLKDIDSIIDGKGDFREIYDINVIVNSINNILNIPKGSYICDPNYGVGLEKYLFEPADDITRQNILNEVKNAISNYEKRANIQTEIYFFSNKNGFQIRMSVTMDGVSKELKVNIVENLIKNI